MSITPLSSTLFSFGFRFPISSLLPLNSSDLPFFALFDFLFVFIHVLFFVCICFAFMLCQPSLAVKLIYFYLDVLSSCPFTTRMQSLRLLSAILVMRNALNSMMEYLLYRLCYLHGASPQVSVSEGDVTVIAAMAEVIGRIALMISRLVLVEPPTTLSSSSSSFSVAADDYRNINRRLQVCLNIAHSFFFRLFPCLSLTSVLSTHFFLKAPQNQVCEPFCAFTESRRWKERNPKNE